MTKSPPRRRPPKRDTERALAIRTSARHLKDLRRAHRQPPADVAVNTRGVPKFVPPIIEQSYCTSPAALCAELGETAGADTVTMETVMSEPETAELVTAELVTAELIDAETGR